ncbi:AraC family transcriptional regulator [Leptospira sp. SA-E8]|uniref:AraC family transcriptional regulator n=1 Tax=Leptospira sp. SA-E8 TaxID=3422259 RepID=UPI003EB7D7ED
MNVKSKSMIELLEKLIPEEGFLQNVIDKVDLFRTNISTPRIPQCYDSGIIILAQGQKKAFLGEKVFLYDPMNYLVLSVPIPMECMTTASKEKPMLGFRIQVDAISVGEIVLSMDKIKDNTESVPHGIYSSAMDAQIMDASIRLLEALSSPADSHVLGPMIVKEIIYRVIQGENGFALRSLVNRNQHFFQISRILDKIHKSYGEKLDINTLAIEAGMSVSAFHTNFKIITKMAPLQYIKNVRLHKAKMLMMHEGIKAHNAAIHVGYESPSQFNREYKRLFGNPPVQDVVKSNF